MGHKDWFLEPSLAGVLKNCVKGSVKPLSVQPTNRTKTLNEGERTWCYVAEEVK